MRIILGIICLALLPFVAHARPLPHPPSDFRGDVYVDNRGCVFNRDGHKWLEREVDGKQICGFPPSLSPLRHELVEKKPLPSMIQIEQDLLGSLASELRQGELVADGRDAEHIAEAPAAYGQDKFTTELTALMRHNASQQAAMSGSFRAHDICKRLGYRAELDPRPVLGWDVTMGLCPATRSTTPQEKISFGKRLGDVTANAQPAVSTSAPDAAVDQKVTGDASTNEEILRPPSSRNAKKQHLEKGSSSPRPPQNTRIATAPENSAISKKYIKIGSYRDDETARRAIRGVADMGYPAAQTYRRQDRQTIRIIFAGPFNEQNELATALTALRNAGYARASIR